MLLEFYIIGFVFTVASLFGNVEIYENCKATGKLPTYWICLIGSALFWFLYWPYSIYHTLKNGD